MGYKDKHFARLAVSAGLVAALGGVAVAPVVAVADNVAVEQGGTQNQPSSEKKVATVDGQAYDTLAEAIEAATGGKTVEVQSDLTAVDVASHVDKQFIEIAKENADVTINLNKHKISLDAADAISIKAANVKLKICDGSIENARSDGYGLYVYHNRNADAGYDDVNVTFDSVTLTTKDQAIGVQGNNSNNNVTLKNCVINVPNSLGAYWPPKSGTLTIDGTTINAGTGVLAKGGKISITGNTVTIPLCTLGMESGSAPRLAGVLGIELPVPERFRG